MDHLEQRCIGVTAKYDGKSQLFEALARRCGDAIEHADQDKVLHALSEREVAGNTGVGFGVAMPHATVPGLTKTHLLVEVLASPIVYDALDGTPVDVIFCTVGPAEERNTHLLLISSISRLILETAVLEQIRDSKSSEDVMKIFERSLL
jgi:mannitol/fructose-specific phosphotransferase system IIA component (Ntr-type)